MIRLSKLTDYAVVVMTAMMHGEGGSHTATSLAERTGLPAPTVSKILKLLARDGLMASHRGATGGYRLARPPEAINVAQIIAAIDGPIALTDCVEGSAGACGVESLCPRKGNWDRVNRAVRGALEGVSLADMARPMFADPVMPPKAAPALPAAADAI
ncbi:SUF system Fe-S cluster assembly regulator [Azospirillum sp. B4]|uniref:SUF system Fe-S cluster assembly regulator n=1 Tax=Azospirillum sp. B4 TaxID=95605 RepID=UPI000347C3F2|nr:SUF system Fe-S cluster assembly regulator [Azospirillum sp. B4]